MTDHQTQAIQAATALLDKKAQDVLLLHVAPQTSLADYFLIATARSAPLQATLSEAAERVLGGQHPRIPGPRDSAWHVLDFGWLVVHLFLPEQREYYNLERLWQTADNVVALPDQSTVDH